jgi:hypothetical protein
MEDKPMLRHLLACGFNYFNDDTLDNHQTAYCLPHIRLPLLLSLLIALLPATAALADDSDSVQPELGSWSPEEKQVQTDSPQAPLVSEEEACTDSSWPTRTLIAGRMRVPVKRKLERCHEKALQRLQEMESCRQLFSELGANGTEEIRKTLYLPAPRDQELSVCTCAVAFTTVGNRQIFLCDRFSNLSDVQATFILIHEALHSAGLEEQPHSPDALSSNQITDMVRARCGFRVSG